ncbi:MAG: mercury transporter MerT [Alphaproteobacteria bacterium]|nr:mercury transporter MerT [Alphaproteobacteria bacterium]
MGATLSEIGGGTDHATTPEVTDRTPRLLAAGGILAALGAASCCVIPFALFLAGVSGAWIGNLTALEPYQPVFAVVSLALVASGAWRLRRKRAIACASGYCATRQSNRLARIGLWLAAVLVVIAVLFPYAARRFL